MSSAMTADDPTANARSAAGRAFWATMRRITLVAAAVDVWFFVLFRYLGVPALAWPNVSSVALYLTAYGLIRLHANAAAVALIWIEVLLHATAGTFLLGWESGFHYYMLLFIPAIVISCRPVVMRLLLSLLFACYVGLDVASYLLGASAPLPEVALALVRWTNMAIVFAMLAHSALCYGSRLRAAEQTIRISATHDLLTGLLNRQHFLAMTDYVLALQRRSGRPSTVVAIEIDQLQMPGRLEGEIADRVLTHVCHQLRTCCRQEDVIARWQGDELVALLPDTALDAAQAAAERLREAIAAASLAIGQQALRCTVSIGLAQLAAGEPFHEALRRADIALARCRARGGDCAAAETMSQPDGERRWA
jgi:diguanylate cyclase (GGDEF)-like protein